MQTTNALPQFAETEFIQLRERINRIEGDLGPDYIDQVIDILTAAGQPVPSRNIIKMVRHARTKSHPQVVWALELAARKRRELIDEAKNTPMPDPMALRSGLGNPNSEGGSPSAARSHDSHVQAGAPATDGRRPSEEPTNDNPGGAAKQTEEAPQSPTSTSGATTTENDAAR